MILSLVSIALCTYNGDTYLKEQLDTLVNQSYPNIEIVVVDDCSTDETLTILNEYTSKYHFISVFQNTENLGYVKNFQKAISLCKGDFIALADQDDIWDLYKIENLVDAIGDHLLIYHDSLLVDSNGNSLHKKMSDILTFYSGSDSRCFLLKNCVSGHSLMFNSTLLSYFDEFKSNIFHDWWLTYVACNVGSIYYLEKCLAMYRQHDKTNTNVLKRKSNVKKVSSADKVRKEYEAVQTFNQFPLNKDKVFVEKLYRLYKERMNSYFSFNLAFFVFKYKNILFKLKSKSSLTKMNFKYFWGLKLMK